jgi:hypothetical protein
VGIDTSYLNLGRLPLLAFLCRGPLASNAFWGNANWNELKEICTRGAKAIYMASAFFPRPWPGVFEQQKSG